MVGRGENIKIWGGFMMENLFSKAISIESNKTKTENGANAFKSTNDSLVDLFAIIGSLRSRRKEEIEDLFTEPMLKILYWRLRWRFTLEILEVDLAREKLLKQ